MTQSTFSEMPFAAPDRIDKRAWAFLNLCADQHIDARLVGGCVRDALLNQHNSVKSPDIDIAIAATPQEVIQFCDHNQINYFPTGIDHGTLTLLYKGLPMEVTSLRCDVKSDGRHAEVAFGTSFIVDATRRDFTINALYVDHKNILYDAFNGVQDLHNRCVRFIGDAHQRIAEDYLRLWRYFRFWGRFGNGCVDLTVLPPLHKLAESLTALSIERIQRELLSILAQPWPNPIIQSLCAYGLLEHTFKAPIKSGFCRRLIILERTSNRSDICPIRRLSALLASLDLVHCPLKLSRAQQQKLKALMTKNLKEIALTNPQWWIDANLLVRAKAANNTGVSIYVTRQYVRDFMPLPLFPITAKDLLCLGYTPGVQMGDTLRRLKSLWFDYEFQLDKKVCLRHAAEWL
jgi:poly(A) polymerase